MAKRITVRDLAKMAGVSHAAVSLALRNSSEVGVETRQRIQALAAYAQLSTAVIPEPNTFPLCGTLRSPPPPR